METTSLSVVGTAGTAVDVARKQDIVQIVNVGILHILKSLKVIIGICGSTLS